MAVDTYSVNSKQRILIIGTYRSGTQTLTRAFSEIFKIKSLQEPWNRRLHIPKEHIYPDCIKKVGCVKTLVHIVPPGVKNFTEFYTDMVTYFDHVVFLGRRDRVKLAESFHTAEISHKWRDKYYLGENYDFKLEMEVHNWVCDLLVEVSEELKIPITWYEDLYSGDMDTIQKCIDKWSFDIDIQKLFKYIDPQHKYRLKNPKSVI